MKPRERMENLGPDALTDYELIAILLRTGTKEKNVLDFSKDILKKYGSLSALLESSIDEIKEVKGIGNAKSTTLKAIMELAKRYYECKISENNYKFNSPDSTFNYLKSRINHDGSEKFCVIFLDNSNSLIKFEEMFQGNNRQAPVFVSEILKKALKLNATSIIVAHNHPTGNTNPSNEDIKLTEKLFKACKLVDLNLLDHIVFSKDSYTSLSEIGVV